MHHSKPDFKPNYKRRARFHDYYAPCIYHITLSKQPLAPYFGQLAGDCNIKPGLPGSSFIELNHLGAIISSEIKSIPLHHPIIQLYQFSVMPDHVHILLRVTKQSPKALGYYVANLMGAIRRRWREFSGNDYPVFEKGYNDRIINHNRPLDTLFRYIRENPYRLAVRREHPEFFRRVYNVKIGDNTYQTYGNQFLLHNPFKSQVVIHRRNTPDENARLRDKWLHTASNGGVLVSPFISPAEKAIRAEAESLDANIILIQHTPFPDRYKPSGHDFDLCCRGHLLIISPAEQPTAPELSRMACLTMNALAATIASPI